MRSHREVLVLISFAFVFLLFLLQRHIPCVLVVGCTSIRFAETDLRVSVRVTPEQQERGLSGTWYLPERAGMLFVFAEAEQYSFWMKDMNYPIDIVWIDANRQVVAITENATPESYPLKFTPPVPVKYVLEVRSGWNTRHRVKVGDVTNWDAAKF